MDKTRKGWLLGLAALVVAGGFFAAAPSFVATIEGGRMVRRVDAGKELFLAMASGGGYPADLRVHSTQEYLDILIQKGVLKISDLALFGDIVVANVSDGDPSNTVVLISRSYYNYLYHETKLPKEYVVIRRGGDVVVMRQPLPKEDLPPREPSILPPRRLALD